MHGACGFVTTRDNLETMSVLPRNEAQRTSSLLTVN